MPKWLHSRAEHLQAKNPSMPKSEAFAIATQQAEATGHVPKGYGTPQGHHEAKQKYKTPRDDEQRAKGSDKTASSIPFPKLTSEQYAQAQQQMTALKTKEASPNYALISAPLVEGLFDELEKIAIAMPSPIHVSAPKSVLKPGASKVAIPSGSTGVGPAAHTQPVLNPPPVRA